MAGLILQVGENRYSRVYTLKKNLYLLIGAKNNNASATNPEARVDR